MTSINRRRFVQQTAFAAAALCTQPIRVLAGTERTFTARKESDNPLDAAAIRKLASQITGHVITPEMSDYEPARLVGNLAYDRHPAVIVRCASPSDVARALDFGQNHHLPLAVRGGGHSAAGFGVCDGGVVIDLSGMRRIEVDPRKHLARAEAGALVGNVDEATQRFGLATPMGTCPTVGIAGLTLGGGEGALMPKYGAACDNLVSAQVVTVDGSLLRVSQESYPDLFWAIRGGGGNFGVVTALEYRLHRVTEVLAGALIFPPGRIPGMLQAYGKFTGDLPDEMSTTAMVLPSENGPRFQMGVGYCGQPSVGTDLLRPLRAQIKPQEDTVEPMSHLEAQRMWFPAGVKPDKFFVTNLFLPELGEAAIAAITAATQDAPARFRVMIVHFHGAVTRVPSNEMAFDLRMRGYEIDITGHWNDQGEKRRAVRWVNALRDALQPYARGLYVNGLSDPTEALMRMAYGPNYARLVKIKKKYDPNDVLRLNPNIRPPKVESHVVA